MCVRGLSQCISVLSHVFVPRFGGCSVFIHTTRTTTRSLLRTRPFRVALTERLIKKLGGSGKWDSWHVADTRSYIILCEVGDRSCHYWISTASLSRHTTQTATDARGRQDGERGGRTKAGRERDTEEEVEGKGMREGRKEGREPRWLYKIGKRLEIRNTLSFVWVQVWELFCSGR